MAVNTKSLNDAAKAQFYFELEELEKGDSIKGRERAKKLRVAAEKIKCFYCLDYTVVYRDRQGALSNLDGRGDYDIINCLVDKGNDHWYRCSHGPSSEYPGIVKRGDREKTALEEWLVGKGKVIGDSLVDCLTKKIGGI